MRKNFSFKHYNLLGKSRRLDCCPCFRFESSTNFFLYQHFFKGLDYAENPVYHIIPSKAHPDLYFDEYDAMTLCGQQQSAHRDQLAQLPILGDFTIEGFDRKPDSTLADLIDFGANLENRSISGDVIYYYRQELSCITK